MLVADHSAMDVGGGYDGLMQACIGGYQGHVSHRLQAWDFSAQQIPDMTDGEDGCTDMTDGKDGCTDMTDGEDVYLT